MNARLWGAADTQGCFAQRVAGKGAGARVHGPRPIKSAVRLCPRPGGRSMPSHDGATALEGERGVVCGRQRRGKSCHTDVWASAIGGYIWGSDTSEDSP